MATATPIHPSAPIHPSHQAARERMASDLADAIWRYLHPLSRRDPHVVARIAEWDDTNKLIVAEAAGRDRVPSQDTWTRAVEKLRRLVAAERGEFLS